MEIVKNNLVSVIVPIYKVELFILECVISLIKQDYDNLEIILIDDGSPDRCGEIIDDLARVDDRIIVIHKKNGGVSSARNEGLRIARGDFIMFVDGDDYVEPDYVSYYVSLIKGNHGDIAVGKNVSLPTAIKNNNVYCTDTVDIIEGIYLNYFGVAVWNKIYRHDIIKKQSLTFDENIWYGEGMLFNIIYLQYAEKAVVGERHVYHVRDNPESATRKFNLDNQFCGMRSMILQKKHWIKSTRGIEMAWEYHYRLYAESILQGLIITDRKEKNKKLFRKCVKSLRRNIHIPLQTEISARLKENSILMAICPTGFIRDKLGIIHNKGDNSDILTRRLLRIGRKLFNKIPMEKKKMFFDHVKTYYQKHYRPVNVENILL